MNDTLRQVCATGALIVIFLVSGCYGGHTTRFVVPLDNAELLSGLRPVKVASLEREEEGIRLINVGVKAWGKFDDDDQANIRASLENTLIAATRGRVVGNTETINIYIVIRKYIVGVSNNAAAVWAGVDWCAADANNQVLFQEVFYATSTGRLVVTTGGVKDDVNFAIVKRIAQSTVGLAASSQPVALNVPDTYSTYEEAAATMPQTLRSWGMVVFIPVYTTQMPGYIPGTDPERFQLELAAINEPIDWQTRLAGDR
jgi:hypothetical protein